jgi:hypothetical protein
MIKNTFHLLIIFFISLLLISCTAVREYKYNIDQIKISSSIDSIYSKIGLQVRHSEDFIDVDGPLNRDLKISLNKINEESTLLKFETASFNEFYIENMNSVLSSYLSNELHKTRVEKSKAKFTVLNIISPGFGWYYLTDNSVYWPRENAFPSMAMAGFDALLLYYGLSDKENHVALISAIFLRVFLLVPGYYFIEYDNKIYKAGININF